MNNQQRKGTLFEMFRSPPLATGLVGSDFQHCNNIFNISVTSKMGLNIIYKVYRDPAGPAGACWCVCVEPVFDLHLQSMPCWTCRCLLMSLCWTSIWSTFTEYALLDLQVLVDVFELNQYLTYIDMFVLNQYLTYIYRVCWDVAGPAGACWCVCEEPGWPQQHQ